MHLLLLCAEHGSVVGGIILQGDGEALGLLGQAEVGLLQLGDPPADLLQPPLHHRQLLPPAPPPHPLLRHLLLQLPNLHTTFVSARSKQT